MTTQSYEATLKSWAKSWEEQNLTKEDRRLINQSHFDLLFGPVGDGSLFDVSDGESDWVGYPGFTTAITKINKALQYLPRVLYVNDETEEFQLEEPSPDICVECEGQGNVNDLRCLDCGGIGCFYDTGWWEVQYNDIVKAIVGKELVEYVR